MQFFTRNAWEGDTRLSNLIKSLFQVKEDGNV